MLFRSNTAQGIPQAAKGQGTTQLLIWCQSQSHKREERQREERREERRRETEREVQTGLEEGKKKDREMKGGHTIISMSSLCINNILWQICHVFDLPCNQSE